MIGRDVVSGLADKNVTAARILARVAAQPRSSCCNAPLGGSAARWCLQCGRSIPANEIDHDYHPPGGAR